MDMPMSNKMTMQMSFYWGKQAIMLFSGWPNDSLGMYIIAIFFVFFLAMAAEVLTNLPVLRRVTTPIAGGLIQATTYAFRITFIYLVMLAVMSYNLGILIAAIAGHTFGFFITKTRALAMANTEGSQSSPSKF